VINHNWVKGICQSVKRRLKTSETRVADLGVARERTKQMDDAIDRCLRSSGAVAAVDETNSERIVLHHNEWKAKNKKISQHLGEDRPSTQQTEDHQDVIHYNDGTVVNGGEGPSSRPRKRDGKKAGKKTDRAATSTAASASALTYVDDEVHGRGRERAASPKKSQRKNHSPSPRPQAEGEAFRPAASKKKKRTPLPMGRGQKSHIEDRIRP
jgi:hypothetical protein